MPSKFSDLEVDPKFSDLEVAPKSGVGLDSHYYQAGLEHDTRQHNPTQSHLDSHKQVYNPAYPEQHSHQRRICGLAPRNFWIVVVIGVLAVIGGAVGGGIGGTMVHKSNNGAQNSSNPSKNPVQLPSQDPASIKQSTSSTTLSSTGRPTDLTTTPSRTSTVALTTTQVIGPTYTLQRDCPSSNDTLYSTTIGSENLNFRKLCGKSYLNTVQSVGAGRRDAINAPAATLNKCIDLCAEYNVRNATGIADAQDFACNTVCWRNGQDNDDFPGQCFGFTTQYSPNSFVVRNEAKCDSAVWIDQRFL